MESEKVKEIKKALEDNKTDHLPYIDGWKCKFVEYADILTLINELESENERLNECYKVKAYDKLRAENKQLKKRIAELEKDNELLRNAKVVYENVDYCYEDLKKAEKRIAELEKEIEETPSYSKGYADGIKNTYEAMLPQKLENFAERLKEKVYDSFGDKVIWYNDIDETLKEFINEKPTK